ncbi:hypothetical protein SPFM8_00009 [Salmonella phage SPFM8]|nr:hypothetical protein SPFM8_00009 [Salmonella phage SPFM8]
MHVGGKVYTHSIDEWLNEQTIYPLYDRRNESEAPEPTHFELNLRCGCASKAEWLKALYEPLVYGNEIWAEFKYSNVNYSTLVNPGNELNTNFLIEYLPDGISKVNPQFRAFIQAQSFAITGTTFDPLLMGVKQRLNVQVDLYNLTRGQVYDATANIQYTTKLFVVPRWLDANRGYRLSFLDTIVKDYTAVTETVDGAYSMCQLSYQLARGETYGGTDIVKRNSGAHDTFYIASNAGNELPYSDGTKRLPIDGSRVKFNGLTLTLPINIPLESIPLWCDIQSRTVLGIKLVSPFLVDDNGTVQIAHGHIIKTNLVMAQETPAEVSNGEECTFLVYSDTGNVTISAADAETVVKQAIPGSCLEILSGYYKDGVLKKNYLPVQNGPDIDGVRILRGSSVNDDAVYVDSTKLPPTMVIDDAVTFVANQDGRLNGHYPLRSDRYRVVSVNYSVPSWETEPFGGVGGYVPNPRDLIVNDMTSGFDRKDRGFEVWDPSELYEPNKPT